MYEASHTGVAKINLLSAEVFGELFNVNSVSDVQNLFVKHKTEFEKIIANEGVPKQTRKFLYDFVDRASKKKFNETMAMKALPLLYSMSTRAGGNSMIKWAIFNREKGTKGIEATPKREGGSMIYSYSLDPHNVRIGEDVFDLLNSTGKNVLQHISKQKMGGKIIPWARVDYRTTRPIMGKDSFAIIDIGMGTVGTHEKDILAGGSGVYSNIANRLIDAVLTYHREVAGSAPKNVVIAISNDYFDKEGKLAKSKYDIIGLKQMFKNALRSPRIFAVPYSDITAKDKEVSVNLGSGHLTVPIERNDLIIVYNPNKPMELELEQRLTKHVNVLGARRFAAISDKRINKSLMLIPMIESEAGRVIVPRKGQNILVAHQDELYEKLKSTKKEFPNEGVVVKLPLPIEVCGKALPSAVFFNPKSEFQTRAMARALQPHVNAGAREFVTEQLMPPHKVRGTEGGIEMRFYHAGRTSSSLVHRRK